MIDIWKNAKLNKEVLYFEKFHEPKITWEDIVKFIYTESITKSSLKENFNNGLAYPNKGGEVVGNLYIDYGTYLLPQTSSLHNIFEGVSELMEKVNGNNKSDSCNYYNGPIGDFPCNCNSPWHIQGLRFCIADKVIQNHNDPCDVLYWQILGSSYWTINSDKVYKLSPGDLLYFNKEDSHMVHQDGPRVGIIIDGKK